MVRNSAEDPKRTRSHYLFSYVFSKGVPIKREDCQFVMDNQERILAEAALYSACQRGLEPEETLKHDFLQREGQLYRAAVRTWIAIDVKRRAEAFGITTPLIPEIAEFARSKGWLTREDERRDQAGGTQRGQ